MLHYEELTEFGTPPPERVAKAVAQKIGESATWIREYLSPDPEVDLSPESFANGEVPFLTLYDRKLLSEGARLVELPQDVADDVKRQSSHDRTAWNTPEAFLRRLEVGQLAFKPPVMGESPVMQRLNESGKVVSFDNLALESPIPTNGRERRSKVAVELQAHNIMGQGRMPFALGSVPDVGSLYGYITAAQANCMAFVSRDKVYYDPTIQAGIVSNVISTLRATKLPEALTPNEEELKRFWSIDKSQQQAFSPADALHRYIEAIRDSWVANVGAAIEASIDKGLERAEMLYQAGCRLIRIYSPEGGREIIKQVEALRSRFGDDLKIVAGQMMDVPTAVAAQAAGADGLIIGVAGGSQCTTSKNADIPVNTPNLLYDLRGEVDVPIGVEGGGVGSHTTLAIALGASFLLKPGEIGVSVEGAGARNIIVDKDGRYWMLYGGEASTSSKWWRDSVDKINRPRFVEGEPGIRRLPEENFSMTANLNNLLGNLANGLVFHRVGRISELHQKKLEGIVELSPEAASLRDAYGR